MGSGKTTLGKKLANKINLPFFDLDLEIEKEEGRSIEEIFNTDGEQYFRRKEQNLLHKFCSQKERFVMALGGGTPCFYENIKLINQSGISIYIKYNPGILASRLMDAKIRRPLIARKNEDELKSYIARTLQERESFYSKSKFTIEKDNVKIENIIELTQNL